MSVTCSMYQEYSLNYLEPSNKKSVKVNIVNICQLTIDEIDELFSADEEVILQEQFKDNVLRKLRRALDPYETTTFREHGLEIFRPYQRHLFLFGDLIFIQNDNTPRMVISMSHLIRLVLDLHLLNGHLGTPKLMASKTC